MLKFMVAAIVSSAVILTASDAFAGHGRCGGGGYYYAPAPAVAPAPVPMAAVPQANRTYSYQPAQPNYRPYGSWVPVGRAYENATNKALGRGF